MRLHSLYLQNYIGIYNGIGRDTISIDFSKCINPITVIRGDNGSGKSTLFKALTPFSDPSTSLIPNREARKIISYSMPSGEIIQIDYRYPISNKGERKQTRCYVNRISNGQSTELNPNGNIKDGKDIINDVFDFDPTFVSLSQLSSDNRGIADKRPSERKQLINSIMESLSVYNDIYKNLTKKSSALKAMISSINSKISSIGNVSNIELNIKMAEEELGSLEDKKNELLVESGKYKNIIDSIDYQAIMNEYISLKNEISSMNMHKLDISNEEIIDIQNSLPERKQYLEKLNTKSAELNAKIDALAPIMADTYNEYTDLDIKISQYDSIENIESFKKTIDSLEEEISALKEIRDTNKIDLNISEQEIQLVSTTIKDSIERALAELQSSEDAGSRELAAISMFDPNVRIETVSTHSIKENIMDIEKAIQEQETYKNLSTNYSLIPKECGLKEQCPFVKDTVKYQKLFKGDATLDLLKRTLESEKKKLEEMEANNAHMEETLMCKNKMTHIISQYNAHKAAFIALGLDLSNINQFEEFLTHGSTVTLETSNFENLKNIDSLIVSKSEQLEKFKTQYFELTKNIDMINSMKDNREKILVKYKKYTDSLNSYKEELKAISEQISNYQQSILSDEELVSEYMVNLDIQKRYDSKSAKRDELYTTISKYKEAEDKLNKYLDAIRELNINKIPSVTNKLNELKYNLVLYQDYTKEYKEFSSKYSSIETIKKYASPTSGIQTIFMNIYMNDIISISNKLLGMMFNGEFVLHPFIINENEFRIPCSGSGFLNDDISSMSTSQICLISTIISFALLHKSSSIYNIAMLDEIDGGLDNQNRLHFSNLITKLMQILGFEQTIMISHNSELDLHNCDIIIMKQSDPTMKLNGNIIFRA